MYKEGVIPCCRWTTAGLVFLEAACWNAFIAFVKNRLRRLCTVHTTQSYRHYKSSSTLGKAYYLY